jgi:signal transduction histidine kinase
MRFPSIFSNLRLVLIMQVALPVLLVLAFILAIGLSMVGQFIEERMQRDLQQVARTIHLPVSQALERQDLDQLQNSMASVFGITEVYGAYLFDANGKRLSSFGVVNPTQEQATDALEQIMQGEFAQYERIRGRDVYSFFMPLFDATGQPNGLLQVTRRRSDIDRELTELKYWAWGGFGLVSLIILGVISYSHQRAIEAPLQRLVESMRRVSHGDRQHRAAEQGPIEISQLAKGLNGMLDAIEQVENSEAQQRTAREQMAERLRQTETMAALGQLSAGVAHELGAPLTVVDGRANRLLRRMDNEKDIVELNEIRQQAARMTSIIQQLLSFGRSSRAQMRDLDLTSLVERSESLLANQGYQITLIKGPQAKINGDSLSLEQALINLLRNACQACPDGPVELSWQVDEQLHIHIDDAGPGITADQQNQVFEPFVTTKAPGEGSGLGLAIVQRIMREHQGEVVLSESPLGGARFTLFLPLVTTQDSGTAV